MTNNFRDRLKTPGPLLGSLIKTPAHQNIEVASLAGLDFVAIDAEHAPFSVNALDLCLLSCAVGGIPGLVRIPDASPVSASQALDLGAAGIIFPHVTSRSEAEAIVAATRYRGGNRGFSNSSRAGSYGRTSLAQHRETSDRSVAVIAQLEDPEAVDRVDEILSVSGIDAVLIGRADLAVSYGVDSIENIEVKRAVRRILDFAHRSGVPCGIFTNSASEARDFYLEGAQFAIVGSDQSTLLNAWTSIAITGHSTESLKT